jgi:hypothetical protein
MDKENNQSECPNCGISHDITASFCPHCGSDPKQWISISKTFQDEMYRQGYRLRKDIACTKCSKRPVFSKTEVFQTQDAKVSTLSCNPFYWLVRLIFLPFELLFKALLPRQERTWNRELYICSSCENIWNSGETQVSKRSI